MTRPQTLADRRAYLEDDLTGLACDRCGAQVRVRKTSAAQTSVQWSLRATGQCAEFAAHTGPSALIGTCPAMRDTIERAVAQNHLPTTSRPGA